jgi:hypothetical protein
MAGYRSEGGTGLNGYYVGAGIAGAGMMGGAWAMGPRPIERTPLPNGPMAGLRKAWQRWVERRAARVTIREVASASSAMVRNDARAHIS